MNFLKILKFYYWIKNFFVILSVIFGRDAGEPKCILKFLIIFFTFCMFLLFIHIVSDILYEK